MVHWADPQQNPYVHRADGSGRRKGSRFWLFFFLIFGLLAFGFLIMVGSFYYIFKRSFEPKTITVRSHSVLQLKVTGEIEEYVSARPLAILGQSGSSSVSFLDILTAVRRAKSDHNIDGLYYRSGGLSMGFAKATELREALLDFRKSGKFIYAYIDVGGELDYYFASVADSIFMPVEGGIELNGFAVSQIFWKGTLNKLGIEPFITQFEEYKSAYETYGASGFSPYSREEWSALLAERYQDYVKAIADSRNLDRDAVQKAMNRGIYSADSALALHFIDAIRSEASVKQLWNPLVVHSDSLRVRRFKSKVITLSQYVRSYSQGSPEDILRDKEIAIVYGSGMMVPGRADGGGPFGEPILASESFNEDLRHALEEKRVKAIILRIDSPGGAVLAADAVWSEIQRTKKVKPIYASLSDVAASGGYYMAMACDTIITHPATLTGSIGVIAMIPNLAGTLAKIGATSDTIATSAAALFMNPLKKFSEQDKRIFQQISAPIYKRFVQRVADSRNKSFKEIRQVARGRVWSGRSALAIGLADTLGGLQTAVQIAKRRIGVSPQQRVRLRIYPEPRDPFDSFMDLFQDEDPQDHLGRTLAKMDLAAWSSLSPSIRKQIQYLLTLSYLGTMRQPIAALPFLPIIE